jgi:hypothetical protein
VNWGCRRRGWGRGRGEYLDTEGGRNKRLEELFNNELHNPYCSTYITRITNSRKMRWDRNVARMDNTKISYRLLMSKSEAKRPLGRKGCRLENTIKMDLAAIGKGVYGLGSSGPG